MTVTQTTRTERDSLARPLNLAGTVTGRIAVPEGAISARVILRKTENGAWGGSVPVESDLGAFATPVSIADPGSTSLVAHTALGVDQLDGISELVIGNGSSLSGSVWVEVVFTLPVDPSAPSNEPACRCDD